MVKNKKEGYFVKNLNAIGKNKNGLVTRNLNNISKPLYRREQSSLRLNSTAIHKRKNKRGLMQLE